MYLIILDLFNQSRGFLSRSCTFIQVKQIVQLGEDQLVSLGKDQEVRFYFVQSQLHQGLLESNPAWQVLLFLDKELQGADKVHKGLHLHVEGVQYGVILVLKTVLHCRLICFHYYPGVVPLKLIKAGLNCSFALSLLSITFLGSQQVFE